MKLPAVEGMFGALLKIEIVGDNLLNFDFFLDGRSRLSIRLEVSPVMFLPLVLVFRQA
ncbi:hypothetical protein HY26_10335 [Hyphomonas sp. GM-8P]|nr:hypothetical protein HY26_10335 [Hyphomonas sp. GM-8P]